MNDKKIKAFLQDIIDCNFTQPLVDNITSDVAKDILDYITNLQEENERLNNIINELEKWLKNEHENGYEVYYIMAIQDILDKLKELKEKSDKE